ncbi:sulfotransferase domain-containing protein [Thiohalorhabdus denitrificans]|uniref:Sulfotransferase domain-containing protein n=1 Tax=Thiohalorhabdus denitrificans TaxID=381306 RepID=A0A1G5DCP1_9GAMM|nr:sulfotransferase domain-containing protein [Thiohalorhabdus denitrificans]SCY12523.1 Sulfotransferase domain-containing protein [Thiohalorhabdus denitrificans]
MAFPPDLFLIGAPKAGTTTLAEVLDSHPEISLSRPKEPHFLTQNRELGLEWYRECFDGPEDRVLLDASTSYSTDPLGTLGRDTPLAGVPERLHELSPEARLIYVVREPVARSYSAYWHDVRLGYERLPFREAIAQDPMYLAASDYAGQLERYLPYFPLERILIVRAEDLWRDAQGVAGECFDFIGVPRVAEEDLPALHKNRSYTFNGVGRYLYRILQDDRSLKRAANLARRVMPESAYRAVGRALTKEIPPLDSGHREELEAWFAPKNRRFRELTGIGIGQE